MPTRLNRQLLIIQQNITTVSINSTDLLNALKTFPAHSAGNAGIDIRYLAHHLEVSLPVLVSLLTELEKRDEIVLSIDTTNEVSGGITYNGTVRLMERPPDEF
jgi:hypothetical protein